MIDASAFASRHNAFWASCAPTSEHYVRRVNLEFAERWAPPLDRPKEAVRSAFIAELAFSQFSAFVSGVEFDDIEASALAETKRRIAPLLDDPFVLERESTEAEQKLLSQLERNLTTFFRGRPGDLCVRPMFAGCGYVDASEGDVISGTCLFEVKAVDRQFRSLDIRQLITYCALNYQSKQFQIDSIGIFNPRRGLYFEDTVEGVSREISGQPSQNLFDSIISAISSGDISR